MPHTPIGYHAIPGRSPAGARALPPHEQDRLLQPRGRPRRRL